MIKQYKIINDPVHGFINIPGGIILEIIQHPLFQRLKEIKQLGLTSLVYPGACHTRLNHALGAMHLMNEAVNVLRLKGVNISEEEQEQAMVAILLHDVGHGPFSHALEHNILKGVSHEEITLALMKSINREKGGRITMAIDIFTGDYYRKFLHQLVSSQLDVDRLDYLRRDSFFSGVAEGMIGHERIIKMMNVKDDSLVIEEKGIYSVEKFLISRRLMYWQVYLHKTVIAAEQLLVEILSRARELKTEGAVIPGSPSLLYFLDKKIEKSSLSDNEVLNRFAALDDSDVMSAIKQWRYADDRTLSILCRMLVERRLPAILLSKDPFDGITFEDKIRELIDRGGLSEREARYFVKTGEVQNRGYDREEENIQILSKIGATGDIYEISDMLSAKAFSQITKKYFLCTPKKYYF
ncbi:MAG: phosphohydrolase [Bacteroidetes bacterium 41-46]|nr:MAG: phosphohydrolase [Bacteroidetes bacterium 41-46]